MIPFYTALFERLHELHQNAHNELESVAEEALDWVPNADMNSLTVLTVHFTGAERFLIGDIVMGEPSNRNREAEFQAKALTAKYLLHRIDETEAYIHSAFERLSLADLETTRIHPRHGNQVTVAWALLHALEHVGMHVGHMQMTAQLWRQSNSDDKPAPVKQ